MAIGTKLFTYMGFRLSGDLGKYTMYTYCRRRPVFFLKSPPLTPATAAQIRQRNRFRIVGYYWRSLGPVRQALWQQLAFRARLNITGYNLFLYFAIKQDYVYLKLLIARTGVDVLATE